jgi:hypothetical protein
MFWSVVPRTAHGLDKSKAEGSSSNFLLTARAAILMASSRVVVSMASKSRPFEAPLPISLSISAAIWISNSFLKPPYWPSLSPLRALWISSSLTSANSQVSFQNRWPSSSCRLTTGTCSSWGTGTHHCLACTLFRDGPTAVPLVLRFLTETPRLSTTPVSIDERTKTKITQSAKFFLQHETPLLKLFRRDAHSDLLPATKAVR